MSMLKLLLLLKSVHRNFVVHFKLTIREQLVKEGETAADDCVKIDERLYNKYLTINSK